MRIGLPSVSCQVLGDFIENAGSGQTAGCPLHQQIGAGEGRIGAPNRRRQHRKVPGAGDIFDPDRPIREVARVIGRWRIGEAVLCGERGQIAYIVVAVAEDNDLVVSVGRQSPEGGKNEACTASVPNCEATLVPHLAPVKENLEASELLCVRQRSRFW
jgi:hypothetical protein